MSKKYICQIVSSYNNYERSCYYAISKNKHPYTGRYLLLPDGERAELINGKIYNMAPPNRIHQKLVMELSGTLREYIKSQHGSCEIYPASFAVFLRENTQTM